MQVHLLEGDKVLLLLSKEKGEWHKVSLSQVVCRRALSISGISLLTKVSSPQKALVIPTKNRRAALVRLAKNGSSVSVSKAGTPLTQSKASNDEEIISTEE